jgi:cell division septation protein DedD
MYLRAHQLVSSGQGEAGRALVDSVLNATPPGTPAYAEGLFWRAVMAKRSEDAERDYLRIVIEFPLSPRAEDSLIRLAELELMRGDRMRAQRHLQRLIIEHPNGPARARASYWLARVFFEGNDLPQACNELNVARARSSAADVELRNQLDYQAQRCVGVDVAVAPPAPTPVPATGAGSPPVTASSSTATLPPPAQTSSPPGQISSVPPAPVVASVPPPSPAPARPALPRPAAQSASTARAYSVQAAAFPTRDAATSFMETLKARGYDVRIFGTENPFRVRIGRFATRAEATALAKELQTKMISRDAWVVEAEVR